MIGVTHRPEGHGWAYASADAGIQGGGRTLAESMDSAAHAVRQHLSVTSGREHALSEVLVLIKHIVEAPRRGTPEHRPPLAGGRFARDRSAVAS